MVNCKAVVRIWHLTSAAAFRQMTGVIVRQFNISRTGIAERLAFRGSLKTSSLSVIRLIVRLRSIFTIRVSSRSTRGVVAMKSTISCVSSRGWKSRWFGSGDGVSNSPVPVLLFFSNRSK